MNEGIVARWFGLCTAFLFHPPLALHTRSVDEETSVRHRSSGRGHSYALTRSVHQVPGTMVYGMILYYTWYTVLLCPPEGSPPLFEARFFQNGNGKVANAAGPHKGGVFGKS